MVTSRTLCECFPSLSYISCVLNLCEPSKGLLLGAHGIYDSQDQTLNRVFLLGLRDVLKIGFWQKKMSRIKKAHFSLTHLYCFLCLPSVLEVLFLCYCAVYSQPVLDSVSFWPRGMPVSDRERSSTKPWRENKAVQWGESPQGRMVCFLKCYQQRFTPKIRKNPRCQRGIK